MSISVAPVLDIWAREAGTKQAGGRGATGKIAGELIQQDPTERFEFHSRRDTMKLMQARNPIRGTLIAAIATLAPLAVVHADTFGSGDTAPVVWGAVPTHAAVMHQNDVAPAVTFELLHPQPRQRGIEGPARTDPPAYRGGDSWNLERRAAQRHLGDIGAGTT